MATFESSKKMSDIQEPQLLPEDWYLVRIVKAPKEVPNNARKKGANVEDGGGVNWQVSLRIQHENPDYHGRSLMISLPIPCEDTYPEDAEDYAGEIIEEHVFNNVSGRTIYDEKYERLGHWCAAFSGYAYEEFLDEKSLELNQGAEAMIYVSQGPSFRDPDTIVNNIDIFNSVPMKAE